MEELSYWIWLSRIEYINKKLLFDLLEKYKTPQNLWNVTKKELLRIGISEKVSEKITNEKYKKDLDKYIRVYEE
ncbi:MAG: hypothetical protein FWC79_05950 [Oscillospiraceae bacterium]|nr:hypothetical protein [Oscillospiraceae bacterium]